MESATNRAILRAVSEESVEIVRGIYDRWSAGDLGDWAAFHPGVEYARIGAAGTGLTGEFSGLEEVVGALIEWLQSWADVRARAERIEDIGNGRVMVFSHQTGRGRASGTPLDLRTADIWTLRDGKVVRWESYWDRAQALEAAGVSQ